MSIQNEYISKQVATDAVPEELMVDFMDEFGAGYNSCRNDILRSIESLTPADVAPVVRCKDCKSRRIDGYCTKFQNNISGIAVSWFMPEDDGFCSYGERKGE